MSAVPAVAGLRIDLSPGADPEFDRMMREEARSQRRKLRNDARVMESRHAAIYACEFGTAAWHNAGIAFLREGLKRSCLRDLDTLADIAGPDSTLGKLGDRATDKLFENCDVSDAFFARLRIAAAADPAFEAGLREVYGDRMFTDTLSNAHSSHPDHDAASIPDGEQASAAQSLPQLTLL